ncbi:sugar-binding transcriptional regulator [Kineococcus glutinatus]|uniref:DeoR family transcriptional regulator n=1 Tax=Kineococcus glutinatus TaxID=1070872 RepID=A0ABP9HUG4_9ACTN
MARTPARAGAPGSVSTLALAATVARRFHVEGMTKVEIARQLGVSRFKVARLLSTAVDHGLVRIEIHPPASLDGEMSEELRARFGLRSAFVVVPEEDGVDGGRRAVARFTAGLLEEVVTPEDVVGLAWGRTISVLSAGVRAPLHCRCVQLSGALPRPDVRESAVDVVHRIAEATGSSAVTFYAPLAVPDAATAEGLRSQSGIAEALAEHDSLTRAVVSIGYWAAGESTAYDSLSPADRDALTAAGACAELTGLLFGVDGTALPDLADRVVGVTVEQLRRTPDVIAMASGLGRALGTAAALRSGVVSTLVTHTTHARQVLDLPEPAPRAARRPAARPSRPRRSP